MSEALLQRLKSQFLFAGAYSILPSIYYTRTDGYIAKTLKIGLGNPCQAWVTNKMFFASMYGTFQKPRICMNFHGTPSVLIYKESQICAECTCWPGSQVQICIICHKLHQAQQRLFFWDKELVFLDKRCMASFRASSHN